MNTSVAAPVRDDKCSLSAQRAEFHPTPEDVEWWSLQTRQSHTSEELDAIEQCEFEAWVAALDSDFAFRRLWGFEDEYLYNTNG